MSVKELIQSAQFIVDADGQRKAVIIDVESWNDFLAAYAKANNGQESDTVSPEFRARIQQVIAENEAVLNRLAQA